MQLLRRIELHFFTWFNYFVLSLLLGKKGLLNPMRYELERWGSPYGGWYIPPKLLKKQWVYYLVGVGTDISFDRALVERVGCTVHLFDPTPASIKYMEQFKKNNHIKFHPFGVWQKDAELEFFAPIEANWVSHSVINLQNTPASFRATCKRIPTIMKELRHRTVDVLKLDISGAEYTVLDDLLTTKVLPKVLLIEFDQPIFVFKTYRMILKLIAAGYDLAIRDMWNFTFVRL